MQLFGKCVDEQQRNARNLSSQTARGEAGKRLRAVAAVMLTLAAGVPSGFAQQIGAGVKAPEKAASDLPAAPTPVLTEPLAALPAERLREMEASLPMGRFCTAEEVAEAVVWLLSRRASYVSGAIVPVNGAR